MTSIDQGRVPDFGEEDMAAFSGIIDVDTIAADVGVELPGRRFGDIGVVYPDAQVDNFSETLPVVDEDPYTGVPLRD